MAKWLAVLSLAVIIQWSQDPGTMADGTSLERGAVQAGRCGSFAEIVALPYTVTIYQDNDILTGFQCYRARNYVLIDPGDGSGPIQKFSPYSNIDTTKPGNIKNLTISP